MESFEYEFNMLVVSEGMFQICILYTCCIWWNISVNLRELQAELKDLKGGSGGEEPQPEEVVKKDCWDSPPATTWEILKSGVRPSGLH